MKMYDLIKDWTLLGNNSGRQGGKNLNCFEEWEKPLQQAFPEYWAESVCGVDFAQQHGQWFSKSEPRAAHRETKQTGDLRGVFLN